MTRNHLLAASFAALAFASPAMAQSATEVSEVGNGKAVLLTPFTLLNETDLDFGSYVLPTGQAGSVSLSALDGTYVPTTLIPMPSNAPLRGKLDFAGTPNQPVNVRVSSFSGFLCAAPPCTAGLPTTLTLDGVERAAEPGVYDYVLPGDGVLELYVGGSVSVPAGTADGTYGEDYTVTLSYE